MAQRRRQSLKAQRKDKKRHQRNIKIKSGLKKTLKKLQGFITEKKLEEARKTLKETVSQLAKAAKKKIMHPNTAKRKISRLSRKVSGLEAPKPGRA